MPLHPIPTQPRPRRVRALARALLLACPMLLGPALLGAGLSGGGPGATAGATDLIWCPPAVHGGPVASDLAMQAALIDRGRVVVRCDSLVGFDLGGYESVWVFLGVFPHNHPLTFAEGVELRDYLLGGGRLYIEGGDIWGYDILTPLNAIDGIAASADGGSDLAQVIGVDASPGPDLSDLASDYSGENFHLDHLHGDLPGATTLFTSGPGGYGVGVLHRGGDSGLADFRAIGASFEFGGWTEDPDLLLEVLLIALDLIPDCRGLVPLSPACSLRPQGVEVSWALPALYEELEVLRDGESIAILSPTVTSHLDIAPPAGVRSYTVVARDAIGCEAPSEPAEIEVPVGLLLRRGDVDASGGIDIVDAVELLRGLFVPGTVLACSDAGDFNDSGHLEITDAISLLSHLFAAGPAPAPPVGDCGVDQSEDSLPPCDLECTP